MTELLLLNHLSTTLIFLTAKPLQAATMRTTQNLFSHGWTRMKKGRARCPYRAGLADSRRWGEDGGRLPRPRAEMIATENTESAEIF